MTQESKKFGTKVEFETFDEGGKFEPLKLPDLTPYREANRDSLLKDFEQQKILGLANLKLEQDKYKEVDAWNAEVWKYMAQAGIDRLKPLSKALRNYASGYEARKDTRDAENALIEFQAAYMNGEYGVEKIYAGVPVIIGKNGIEKIEEVELDDKEKAEFNHSIEAVKKLWEVASAIDPDLNR